MRQVRLTTDELVEAERRIEGFGMQRAHPVIEARPDQLLLPFVRVMGRRRRLPFDAVVSPCRSNTMVPEADHRRLPRWTVPIPSVASPSSQGLRNVMLRSVSIPERG